MIQYQSRVRLRSYNVTGRRDCINRGDSSETKQKTEKKRNKYTYSTVETSDKDGYGFNFPCWVVF